MRPCERTAVRLSISFPRPVVHPRKAHRKDTGIRIAKGNKKKKKKKKTKRKERKRKKERSERRERQRKRAEEREKKAKKQTKQRTKETRGDRRIDKDRSRKGVLRGGGAAKREGGSKKEANHEGATRLFSVGS